VSRYDVIKSQRDEAGNRHAVTLNVVVGQCLVEVDVNSLNKQMAQVLSEISKFGQAGGLISDPNTYAEFYHNARILQQRGEIDLAMRAYEQALSKGYLFVDPLLDVLDLANARYGEDGARIYFEEKLKNRIPKPLSDIGKLILTGDPVPLIQPILDDYATFSPLLAIWIESIFADWMKMDTLTVGKSLTKAEELISKDYRSGMFQSFFVDKIRGASLAQSARRQYGAYTSPEQFAIDRMKISRASVYFQRVGMYADKLRGDDQSSPYIGQISITDRLDLTQPITLCAKVYGGQLTCRNLDHGRNAYKHASWYGYHSGSEGYDVTTQAYFPSMLNWTFGMHCAVSVSYTDLLGHKVTSPVLVDHENREEYAPKDLDKIIKCAGDYFRPRG
jgi:tetratricopeptide (TPR) repeat protein